MEWNEKTQRWGGFSPKPRATPSSTVTSARRVCRVCNVEKPLTRPNFQKRTDGRFRWQCKSCRAKEKRLARASLGRGPRPSEQVLIQDPPSSYKDAHKRVRRRRGSASDHACGACGSTERMQWALDPRAPLQNLRLDARFYKAAVYSLSIEDYRPRCSRCNMAEGNPFDWPEASLDVAAEV
jgi:hypothetical protein